MYSFLKQKEFNATVFGVVIFILSLRDRLTKEQEERKGREGSKKFTAGASKTPRHRKTRQIL